VSCDGNFEEMCVQSAKKDIKRGDLMSLKGCQIKE